MRHRVDGRKLGRTSAHRQALLRNLSSALFEKERITTTLAKAKELRRFAERLVTLAKRETLHARRRVLRDVPDRKVVAKLFDTLSARYAQRPGGYTRIIKLGPRRGDNAELAVIELVGAEVATGTAEAPASADAKKTAGKTRRVKTAKPAAGAAAEASPASKAPARKKKAARRSSKKAASAKTSKGESRKAKPSKAASKTTKGGSRSKG